MDDEVEAAVDADATVDAEDVAEGESDRGGGVATGARSSDVGVSVNVAGGGMEAGSVAGTAGVEVGVGGTGTGSGRGYFLGRPRGLFSLIVAVGDEDRCMDVDWGGMREDEDDDTVGAGLAGDAERVDAMSSVVGSSS